MTHILRILRDLVFLEDDRIGLVINLSILLLFLLGVVNALRAYRLIRRERGELQRATVALTESHAEPAADTAEKLLSFLGVAPKTILGRFIARIVELRAKGFGQREGVQQLARAEVERLGSFARYVAGILTVIGLLGTVFGLSIAVMKTQGVVVGGGDVGSLHALIGALSGTLAGMKTAFATTLTGLLSALILSVGNYRIGVRQSRLADDLDAFGGCVLLPALEAVDPSADAAARAFANVLSDSSEKLKAFREGMDDAAGKLVTANQAVAGSAETIAASVNSLEGAVAQLGEQQSSAAESLTTAVGAMEKMAASADKQLAVARKFAEEQGAHIDQRLSSLEKQVATVEGLEEKLQKLADGFTKTLESYDSRTSETMHKALETFNNAAKSLLADVAKRSHESTEAYTATAEKSLGDLLVTHRGEVETILKAHRTGLDGLMGAQTAAMSAVRDLTLDKRMRVHAEDMDTGRGDGNGGDGRGTDS